MRFGFVLLGIAALATVFVWVNLPAPANPPESQELTASVSEKVDTQSAQEENEAKNEAPELPPQKQESLVPEQAAGQGGLEPVDYLLPLENSKPRTEPVSHVVLHFISNGSINPENPYVIEDIFGIFTDYGFSTHYLVARNGTLYRFVQEDRVAYHAGKGSLAGFPGSTNRLNEHSIGIEILAIGTKEEMAGMIPPDAYGKIVAKDIGFTQEQYETVKLLLEHIIERNPGVKRDRRHVVGHEEYAPGRKTDPGSLFDWSQLGL